MIDETKETIEDFDTTLEYSLEDFMEAHKMVDEDEVYSNKIEFVPIFRVKQWLDYNNITNLQEELEDLRESDWAWHQLLKTQNKRMYRSKFLKDFQKEYGTNTYPDYDEIYKRYDKMKSKNEKAIEYCRLNKEFTPRLEDVENILQGSDKE